MSKKPLIEIYTYTDGINDTPFPNKENPLVIPEYNFTDKRMGSATLTATAMYPRCLDDDWVLGKQYAVLRGQKYFINKTPSSSKSNDDTRYKHQIEFTPHRVILDNIYFYDVVIGAADRYVSNSTKVTFYGNVKEFAARINSSLAYSKTGYTVVVDAGISSEEKMVTLEDQFISNVLQEIFNIYELPYYFSGTEIHIGYTNNAITHTFKYGHDYELLSISKQNANYKITNRVTGTGSTENIPFYYPNPSNNRVEIEEAGGSWITPSANLMPPIYRDSNGGERFYNAKNNRYVNPDTGEFYQFENEYSENNPKEQIVSFNDIRPTIKEVYNDLFQRIDLISDVEFDDDDNNEVDANGNFLHPYFYVKLRKFGNGEQGFNLFAQALVGSDAVVAFTSGACSPGNFPIMVTKSIRDGETHFSNPVQVDEKGNIVSGNYEKKINTGNLITEQQDTRTNEVWIALQKETETYGISIPNKAQHITPKQGDSFVFLHISMPQYYITQAEEKLRQAIIKYMAANNAEKFTFQIKLSRIFLIENPDVADLIDSNARIDLEYNGQRHQLYINSYTYKSDKEILPEITLDLTDTLAINKNSLQTAIDSVKQDIMNSIGSQDFLKQGLKYFIRKDVSDYANGRITFNDGLRVYGREAGARNPGGSFLPDINSKVWLETDYLTVRIKAYFEALEIVHMNSVGGRVIITPAGSIKCTAVEDREDLLDENGNKIGETVWDYYRCYFLEEQDGIKVENRFKKGDQAMSEDFNIQEGVYEGVSNHYYWRLVVGTGSNYIDLSKGDCDTGSDAPQIGDVICQLGYRYNDDPQRQNAMIFSAVDLYAPAVTLYNGIDSYSYRDKDYISYGVDKTNNKAYSYCYGDSYVGDRARTSYMEFVQGRGVKIKGQLEIGSTIGDGSTIEDALDKAKQDAIAAANESLTNYANQVAGDIAEIQNQIDGQIESFFEKHNPTLTNYPAVDWVTEEQKQQHGNDTFTNIETGESWRWQKNGDVWEWGVISDTATQKALALAAKAQDTADGKRRIFVRQPKDSEAVDIGDLWVNATYGNIYKNDILRAIVAKEAGVAFNINQWELASKYTDDTKAQEAQDAADKAQAEADAAKARLDKWAEDGIISPTEKQGLKDEIARIKADKDNIEGGYIRYKLGNPEGFLNAYADYLAVLTTLSAPEPDEIEIPADFATKQTKYYDERTDALETIAAATKSLIDAAEAIANAARDRLEEWAKDGVISPVEKQGIKDEIVRIDADNIDINNKYTLYSLGVPTMYIRAYDTYRLNLEALCKETPENIPIPSDFAAIQTSYYNARTTAYKAIDEAAKKLSVDAMEAAKKAQADIDATKIDVNELKGDVAGLKDFTDEAFKDGIIDRSEYAAIQAYIKNIQTIQADVTKNYNEVYNNPLLAGIAKSQLKTSYDAFNASVNELLAAIQEVIADEKVTASERAIVDAKYDVFNTKYGDFIAYLTAANTYIQDQINAKAQSALDELLTFKPVKDAFLEKTLIQGGVILSSFMALGYTKPATDTYEIMSGVNGVYDASAIGGGIAAWYGGNMKDRDSFPAGSIPEDAAKAVIRMDGSGYLAGGAVWWGLDGKFHANPNSFLIEENQLGDYLKLFQIIYLDKDKHIIDYIIPQYPMQNLEVANNLTVGGNIRLKDGILRWDSDNKAFWVEMWDGSVAGFYATSYVSAKGARAGGGGGGGVVSTVYGYTDLGGTFADSDKNNTFNAYTINRLASRITTLEEGGSGLSSITVKLGTTAYDSVDGVVSLPAYPVTLPASDVYAWAKASTKPTYTFAEITSKPTTLSGYGITDAVSLTTGDGRYIKKTGDTMTGWLRVKVNSAGSGIMTEDGVGLLMYEGETQTEIGMSRGITYIRSGAQDLRHNKGGTQYLILDSSNYNNYAPSLTGTKATGTWAIAISGLSKGIVGEYISGGLEKPNYFGSAKMRLQMLIGGTTNLNIGTSWCDVIWVSSYSGSDVKGSHALVMPKNSSDVGNRNLYIFYQNYDSTTWDATPARVVTSLNISEYYGNITPSWDKVQNTIANNNEFNFVTTTFAGGNLYINYRPITADGVTAGTITGYVFSNGQNKQDGVRLYARDGFITTAAYTSDVTSGIFGHGYVQLTHATPYIDFRYGNGASGITSRIIETTSGTLNFTKNVLISGYAYFGGTSKYISSNGWAFLNHSIFTGHGNTYTTGGLEVRGNGTTSAYPLIGFHQPNIQGSCLVNLNNGDFKFMDSSLSSERRVLAQSFIGYDQRFNTCLAYYNSGSATVTGIICITLPNGFNSSMNIYEIDIYEYTADTARNNATITIGGYNYSNDNIWINHGCRVSGGYSKGVRLAYNGSKCVILLGTTTSTWSYPQVFLRHVLTGFAHQTEWYGGYTISVLTSESGLSKISNPPLATQFFGAVNASSIYSSGSLSASGSLSISGTTTSTGRLYANGGIRANMSDTNDWISAGVFAGANYPLVMYIPGGTANTRRYYFSGGGAQLNLSSANDNNNYIAGIASFYHNGDIQFHHSLTVSGSAQINSTLYAGSSITSGGTIKSTAYQGFHSQVGTGTWSFLRLQSGTIYWDLAVKDNDGSGAFQLMLLGSSTSKYNFDTTNLHYGVNNQAALGSSSFRWKNVYSVDANISGTLSAANMSVTSLSTNSLVLPYEGGTWYNMYAGNNLIRARITQSASSVHGMLRMIDNNGDSVVMGGYINSIGFFGFAKTLINAGTNSFSWSTTWNGDSGYLTHSEGMYIGGVLDVHDALTCSSTLSVSSTSTFTGRATFSIGLYAGGYNNSTYDISTGTFICNDWIRTNGKTGWYSQTYGGGIYMIDSSYVRTYGTKKFYVDNTTDGSASDGAISTAGGIQVNKRIWCGSYLTVHGQDATSNGAGIILDSSYSQRILKSKSSTVYSMIDFFYNSVSWSPYTNIMMNIQSSGDIQINGAATGNNAILWIGSAGIGTNSNIWSDGAITAKKSSDYRLKKDWIYDVDYCEKLLSIGKVVDFWYNEKALNRKSGGADEKRHTGLVYQEAEKAGIANFCFMGADGYGSINYISEDFISVIAGAVQSNILSIRTIESKQERMERELEEAKKEIAKLRQELNRLS